MSFTLVDGTTLKNKAGAETHDSLQAAEHPLLAVRLLELRSGLGPAPTFDTAHLQALHRHLFQDVFEWAGELRNHTFTFADGTQASMPAMHKPDGKDFAIGNGIDRGLNGLMSDLESRNFLRGLDRETFVTEAADAFARLNSIHPFREGNGRTQREFFSALAEKAGHVLEFGVISGERMSRASIAAHERADLAPLRRLFAEIADPDRVAALTEAQQAIERFGPKRPDHVSGWDQIYMATILPGRDYAGRFAGVSGSNFMIQDARGAILVGKVRDLPSPRPALGEDLAFTASSVDHRAGLSAQIGGEVSVAADKRAAEPLVPARELPDLSEGEIGAQLAASGRLADKRGEIERLSRLVYGDPLAVSSRVEKIDGAASGQTAAADVMAGRPGPLAGEGVGWFRSESPERQSAHAHLPQLAQALEDYGRAIDFERHRAVRTHADEQYRHRQEIPAPSRELAALLQSVAQEQQARLRAAPALREELGRISLALERRLSPSDKAALYKGDHARLAQSLSIPQERAAAIARLATQTGLVQQQTRRQSLERGPEHVLTR